MDWNLLAAIIIIAIIILIVAAKITGQTVKELLEDLKDLFIDKKDSGVELATQVYD